MIQTSIAELNAADEERFVALLGHTFEESPWIARGAWPERPFADRAALHRAMCAVLARAPLERRTALIAAHPDLVGEAARAGRLRGPSRDEQAAAGLDRLDPQEIAVFAALNAAYRARFGFPFVICVRENRKAAILAGMRARIDNERGVEIAAALAEIEKIAQLRLRDTVTQ
ncbi:MAG: 2-oxo-4-hydroxy-4-carboxy-5-ureidoimidazoline decarboxylase [Candidatus Velthaea sp.]